MRKGFFGIYYKHQTINGYVLAVIVSTSNGVDMVQVVANDKSWNIKDIKSVKASFKGIELSIHQDDLSLEGHISYGELLKTKKHVMSYFRFLPIECKHDIYSMNHTLSGSVILNGKTLDFTDGNGYIEGDKGRSFPEEYLWLNTSSKNDSLTLAVADIPFGLFHFKGVLSLLVHNDKQYRFGTYNFATAKKISREHIVIKKGRYILEVFILDDKLGHGLKAPKMGDMVRTIHECPSMKIRYILKKKDDVIVDYTYPYASFEYVFDK